MTLQRAQQTMLWGFVMAYLAMMGMLLTIGVDVLGTYRAELIELVLLPCAVIGCALIALGKWHSA